MINTGSPNATKEAWVLPPIIANLQTRGFQLVTISKLLADEGHVQ
jgi:hypothetical protein